MAQKFYDTTADGKLRRFRQGNRFATRGRVKTVATGDYVDTGLARVESAQATIEGATAAKVSVTLNSPAAGQVTVAHDTGGNADVSLVAIGR